MRPVPKLLDLASLGLLIASPGIATGTAPNQIPEVLPLTLNSDGLSGPGGERLRSELKDLQFVAVGEDHGLAEPPQLAAALAKELARVPGSPVHHAVEVGPFGALWTAGLLRSGGLAALHKAAADQPYVLPFLSNVEDARLAEGFARQDRLWGIDQEFVGGAAQQFEDLAKRCAGPQAAAILQGWARQDRDALKAGQFENVTLSRLTPDQIVQAGQACGSKRDLSQFEALSHSARIYQHNNANRAAQNNEERGELMLGYFLKAYRAAPQTAPRVVLKMGAYHLGRGTSPTSIYDLGSVLPGLAAANGKRSLHVVVIPLAGSVRSIAPDGKSFTKVSPYKDEDIAPLLAATGIPITRIPEKGLVVIPLRPLRLAIKGKARRDLTEMGRFVLLGFDYLVTTRDAHAATNFEAWDGK